MDTTGTRTSWLAAAGALLLLAAATVGVWTLAFWTGGKYHFYDLNSYRDTLNGVVKGDLMYTWLGYPPVSLIVLSPLRGLPEEAGDRLWTGVSLLVTIGLAAVLAKQTLVAGRTSPVVDRNQWLVRTGIAGTVLMLTQPGLTQLVNGQLTLFVIALTFVDASGFVPRKWQGSLVGLAAALKLTPLIFFPYYVITRQWRQLGVASASFAVFTGIGFALFPADSAYFWLHTNSSERLGPENPENLSINGLLHRWLQDATTTTVIWIVLAAAVAILAYWQARGHFRRGELPQAALVLGIASTSVGPIAWPHYQLWVVLAICWLLFQESRVWTWTAIALFLVWSPAFSAITGMGISDGNLAGRLAWELLVIVPVAFSVFGLPHTLQPSTTTPPADTTAPPQSAASPAVVGHVG